MSSMTVLFEQFIADHEIDITVDDLDTLVKRAIGVLYENTKDVQVVKKEKDIKLDSPARAQQRDDLRNCTKEVLNAFCKENELRVGGSKKEIADRVWRCLQNNSDDDDISPRAKSKKEKKVVEKKVCCGKTAKGTPCTVSGDEMIGGKCYCWRHAKNAAAEQNSKENSESESESESEDEK
jgi:hypothetical protein